MEKQTLIENLNTVVKFLAKRDLDALSRQDLMEKYDLEQVDLLILLGNSSVYVAEQAAVAFLNDLAKKFLISGGIGHSTPFLHDNIKKHSLYQQIPTENKSESEIFKSILTDHFGITEDKILVEKESTNCGSNAEESYKLLNRKKTVVKNILLMQDPVLQRRSEASFRKIFPSEEFQFISYASFVPYLSNVNGEIRFKDKVSEDFCDLERFLSLVMGEIPRLKNDKNGYGPNGKNFITAVDIPEEVLKAYEELRPAFGKYIRT